MQQRLDAARVTWAVTDCCPILQHDKAPVKGSGAAEGTRLVGGVLSVQAVAYVVKQVHVGKLNNADTLILISASGCWARSACSWRMRARWANGCMRSLPTSPHALIRTRVSGLFCLASRTCSTTQARPARQHAAD
jgi:hypothetical protein